MGDEEPIEDGMDAIRVGYQALLRDFATPRIIAQEIGPSWQSPPRANLDSTEFIGAEQARGGVIVKTKEIDHYALPPEDYEYVLKLVDGAWAHRRPSHAQPRQALDPPNLLTEAMAKLGRKAGRGRRVHRAASGGGSVRRMRRSDRRPGGAR